MSPLSSSHDLGHKPIGSLLIKQAVPASIGILVMSLNILVDTIFVGQWIGPTAIAAINVVLPVSFFIAALGMAIGIGGSSIISRALGAGDREKAFMTFGNQLVLTGLTTIVLALLGLLFVENLVPAFGGRGVIFESAKIYYKIVLYGVPVLGFCMMGNTVIRAEGKPKVAMFAMLIPSVGNLLMDILFIKFLGWGMAGAAWATTGSYMLCFLYIFRFFGSQKTELKLRFSHLKLSKHLVAEISSLGAVTLARQAVVSLTYLLVNNMLFELGGASSVTVYAIVSRLLMFGLFPVLGMTQGFLPVAGYNYGATHYDRVVQTIRIAISYASLVAFVVFVGIMLFPQPLAAMFTTDVQVLRDTPSAIRWVFAATPIIGLQSIGAAYFQAVGKAIPALMLTLSRQAFFFIPLLFILPIWFGELGVWMAFPISDLLATIVTAYFLNREIYKHLKSSPKKH